MKNNNFNFMLLAKSNLEKIILLSAITLIFILILIFTGICFQHTYDQYKQQMEQGIQTSILKYALSDWFTYWSEWSITIASITIIFILFPFYIGRLFTRKKIYNVEFIYTINSMNLIYLLLTFILYNGSLILNPNSIINDPDNVQSILEHITIPTLFFVYYIIINFYIKLKTNNYRFIFNNLKISTTFIILYCLWNLWIRNYIPYDIIDYRSLGWKKCLIRMIIFIFSYSSVFYLINIHNLIKLLKINLKFKNKKVKSLKLK